MSSQTKSSICAIVKVCTRTGEAPPSVQCTSSILNSCDNPNIVCGNLTMKPENTCTGKTNGNGCCNSSTDYPWLYSEQGTPQCSNIPGDPNISNSTLPCPVLSFPSPPLPNADTAISTSLCSGITSNCMCAGDAPVGTSNLSTGQYTSDTLPSLNLPGTCVYPIELFKPVQGSTTRTTEWAANNIQQYYDKFGNDSGFNKIMENFCGEVPLDLSKCPTNYSSCSNFVVTDTTQTNSSETGGNLCRTWINENRNTQTRELSTSVKNTMSGYCQNVKFTTGPMTGQVAPINDCQFLNRQNNLTFSDINKGLDASNNTSFPELIPCWFIPCQPDPNILQSEFPVPLQAPGGPNPCPNEICQAVEKIYDSSKITEKDVNQNVSCSQTKNAGSQVGSGSNDPNIRSFYEKNKTWIIGAGIIALILIVLIIIIVIVTEHHKSKPPKPVTPLPPGF